MKINKLKIISLSICCLVAALFSEAQCMEQVNDELATLVPAGSIMAFAGETPPNGWLLCDGQRYSNQDYPKLYEVIKEKYISDAVIEFNRFSRFEKHFCVPDLTGRVIVGVDGGGVRVTSNNMLGSVGGEERHQLTVNEMPNHTHIMGGRFAVASGVSATVCQISDTRNYISESNGNNIPHNNMQPYLVLNYIINAGNLNNRAELYNLQSGVSQLRERPRALFCNDKLRDTEWKEVDWEGFNGWVPSPFKFTTFKGDGNLKAQEDSTIEISEDGFYSLHAFGLWRAKGNENSTAALEINCINKTNFKSVPHCMTRNTIIAGGEASHNLSRVAYLEKGQKFRLSLKSNKKVIYGLWSFQFGIEKIN